MKNWRRFSEQLRKIEKPGYEGTPLYELNISDDKFIHFTPRDRAKQIIQSNKLLFNPPYKKFGINKVGAVSIVWGWYVPEVQHTHIKTDDLIAILFKTNTIPVYGNVEEVLWDKDVEFTEANLVELKNAVHLVKNAPSKMKEEDGYVLYV